jgi:anti-sigma B factor antagonist
MSQIELGWQNPASARIGQEWADRLIPFKDVKVHEALLRPPSCTLGSFVVHDSSTMSGTGLKSLFVYNPSVAPSLVRHVLPKELHMPDQAIASHLTLTMNRTGDEAVVCCSGRLVSGVNNRLYLEVSQLIPNCKRVVLDFTDLTHMDSTGLGTLVRLYVSAKSAGCALQLYNIGKPIRQLLGLTHLLSVLEVIGTNNIRCG